MRTALPSLSGPMYETIHTGLWPHQHGIVSNDGMRASSSPKLYVGQPWDPLRSTEHLDENSDNQAGQFYSMEGYGPMNACAPTEIDLCAQATLMMERHAPDYMLLHSCSADTLGHTFGGDSKEYRRQIWHIDNALSRSIPVWRDLGYDVIVTADHGMTSDHWHVGTALAATEVPFHLFSDADGPEHGEELSQLGIAASVLTLIDVPPAEGMGDAFLSPRPRAK